MNRRRFIKILATGVAGLSLSEVAQIANASETVKAVKWQGYTLGAEGSFTLYTDRTNGARSILNECFKEIQRLESVFSLYIENSELCNLNRNGILYNPSHEWIELLSIADEIHYLTGKLFDPTVQPLWQLYEKHFREHPNSDDGPAKDLIESVIQRVGFEKVAYHSEEIKLQQPGMALTLNGIAQGYITDRVTDCLKNAGFEQVMVELGETRVLGQHPEQRPWQIGIKDAENSNNLFDVVDITNEALATSGGYGSIFTHDGKYHHLIHPLTGLPTTECSSVSVIAPTATRADALSTALSFMTLNQINKVLEKDKQLRMIRQT